MLVSYFHGILDREEEGGEDEAEQLLEDKQPGTYLVHMKGSGAKAGQLILSIVLEDQPTLHLPLSGRYGPQEEWPELDHEVGLLLGHKYPLTVYR